MYHTQQTTAIATDGTMIPLDIQHVDIEPTEAKRIFDQGQETGSWNWKHKVWTPDTIQELMEAQAAARFYYGWKHGSEKIDRRPDGGFIYEAWYAC